MEDHTILQENTQDKAPAVEVPIRYCLYARKSTEQDEKQAMSIESQVNEMKRIARREGLNIVEIKHESHSAKASGQRPVFNEMVREIREGKYDGIITWAPDRLSRNAGDLGSIVDMMDEKLIREIRTFGQKFTDNPNEKFLLMILGAQGKLENDQKSVNVKRGLRAMCEKGLWPAPAPTGYMDDKNVDRKGYKMIDPERAPIIKQAFEKVAYERYSGRQICDWFEDDLDFKTIGGKYLSAGNVNRILRSPFYYGTFEYPKGSGNFYKGRHEPIISKELFNKVAEQLKTNKEYREYGLKDFAFSRLIKCGKCLSGVCAEEKVHVQKNGNHHRYVYYACSMSRDRKCRREYIKEQDLITQFIGLMDEVDLNEIGIREKMKREIGRYNKFRAGVLGMEND